MGRHGHSTEGAVLLAGRYRLIEPIGRGGMAEVWCAEDVSLGRRVAVKLLDPVSPGTGTRDESGGTAGERVWREARGAARLVHPNVVQVYDVAADGDRVFLVMELVTGRDLAAIIDERGPLTPTRTARLGAQAARALAAAHTAGVVHGDVKPANLLLSDDGVLKLTDFGIARPLPVTTEKAGGKVVGTAGYLAPEVALGHPPGKASDLYALGCVLYELSTGQPPFTADTSVSMLHRHLHDPPVPPARLRPDIPPDLEQVILRLLAKHPDGRTGDATRVAEVLELIGQAGTPSPVADEPPNATEVLPTLTPAGARHARPHTEVLPPPQPSPMAWLARRPLLVATLGAVAVIMVAVIVAVAGPEDRPAAGPSQAGTPSAQEPSSARSPDPATRPQSTSSVLIALQQRIAQQADGGRLDRKTADKVTEHLEKIAEHLREGKDDELGEKVTEIRDKLDEASRRGDWTPDPTTLRLLDTLAAAQ
ncbi:protein kinase [Actinomadura sp. 3N508]|uniref:protein kinase domain-containing protein n=1 Tax=Actinomadura sp. 3N508 TaxID=3375153 RepID=UPI00379BF726